MTVATNEIKYKEIHSMLRGVICDITNLECELIYANDEQLKTIQNTIKELIVNIYCATGLDMDGCIF